MGVSFKVEGGVQMKSMVRLRASSYFAMVMAIMIITIHPVYAQEKGRSLRIGFVTSLTGPLTGWGVPASIVYQWVVDQVNKEGGIKSNGRGKSRTVYLRLRIRS